MTAPTVATVHSSTLIDSIDIDHVAHLDQVVLTLWSRGRLVQSIAVSPDNAEVLAGQLHQCVRAAQAQAQAEIEIEIEEAERG